MISYLHEVFIFYSRVHISSDKAFFKILKKPSIVQKKTLPHMKALVIFIEKKQKHFFLKKPIKQKQKTKHMPNPSASSKMKLAAFNIF